MKYGRVELAKFFELRTYEDLVRVSKFYPTHLLHVKNQRFMLIWVESPRKACPYSNFSLWIS